MKTFLDILHIFRDFFIFHLPDNFAGLFIKKAKFAFILHPIDIYDAVKKYTFARFLHKNIIHWWSRFFWPVVGCRVEGLRDLSGNRMDGWIVACPFTTRHMIKDGQLAKRKVMQAIRFAEKIGAEVVGLGAFTSIVTDSGLATLQKTKSYITTGNAYSAAIAIENLITLLEKTGKNVSETTVAVVGGAGSVGSGCSKVLAKKSHKLIVVDKHKQKLDRLVNNLRINGFNVVGTSQISSIKEADAIIVVTSAPGAIIRPSHLKEGVIIVDAAQPKNVARRILNQRNDIIVVESAIVSVPGLRYKLNIGVRSNEALGCFAEVMILSASGDRNDHFSLGEVMEEEIYRISAKARMLGFRLADYRNSQGFLKEEEIDKIRRSINVYI
jgi:fatty aldehyde-generating acyl-ACP reductase